MIQADLDWILELMAVPTVSPLEGGNLASFVDAQRLFAAGAVARGWTQRRWDSPPLSHLERVGVPQQVRATADAEFLAAQPSVVVAIGEPQPVERRLVVNFHMDTVGPHVPPRLDGGMLRGRGAVDDKGPGVAAIAGITAAFRAAPWLAEHIEVQVAGVPGEEGGAMGVYGTRWLVDSGWAGRVMLFAEPTGCRVFDACSAAMTPMVSVHGEDSTDDHPAAGHNATVALGFVATRLAEEIGPLAERLGAKACVAGARSGDAHNRVYGTGELRLNIAYYDQGTATALTAAVERVVDGAGKEFADRFGANPVTNRIAAEWAEVVRLTWLKRGLPALANRDRAMERLLADAGFPRHDAVADGTAFTCDAIWAAGAGRYVAACGPGDLGANGAHTPDEHVEIAELDRYTSRCRDLVLAFGRQVRNTLPQGAEST
ncbi:M20/M25/M40 family metallo-hydrolase [Streptomyces sp. NPDC127108]|uniref:M20/M25/M40 family metallo-hydrolase n=1 Tax=Streptomyces sp. NPDC127108 TaxID=3345361 RepID=UPI00363C9675